MRIALINENSQASKNKIIYDCLKEETSLYHHQVFNYGMLDENDVPLTYVQVGLLSAILLNSKAVDFVITGCGTGEGAMLACNSFPNVLCGLVSDPTDATLFARVNNGNAVAIPFAKGNGWGSELTLSQIFHQLFSTNFGEGYPLSRATAEQTNKLILDEVKKITHHDMMTILKTIDKDFLKQTINRSTFLNYFFDNALEDEIKEYIKNVLETN